MTPAHLRFADVEVAMTPTGALHAPAIATLIVADLHLEKGSSFAGRGTLLPPYDSAMTIAALAAVIDRFRPRRVVCLGDSFHDRRAADRLSPEDARTLKALIRAHDWIWVTGNHDPDPVSSLGGEKADELSEGGLRLRHRAAPLPVAGEVSGHFHPKATLSVRGRRISTRCFVNDERRMILPAFGAYAGGLDVTDPAIAALLGADFTAHLLGRTRISAVPARLLVGHRARDVTA